MQKKACGYIRVSSKKQVDEGESLEAQEKAIKSYIEGQGWKLSQIYRDEGISGSGMEKRKGLKRLLQDATREGEFHVAVISRITRFGRSTVDSLNNMTILKDRKIKLVSLAENLDFDTHVGELIFTVLAAFAKLENEMRAEQSVQGKIISAGKGKPLGKMPHARLYDSVKGEWKLDERKADQIRKAAEDFLNGVSLTVLAKRLKLDYSNLHKILYERCGTDWQVTFKGSGETVKYQIPAILDPETIQEVRHKLNLQKTFKRADIRSYVLNGFIRCDGCGMALVGQTQSGRWSYYRHHNNYKIDGTSQACGAVKYVPVKVIENAVFRTIFENTKDEVGFERAIQSTFPDAEKKDKLKARIAGDKRELKKVEGDIEILIDAVLGRKLLGRKVIEAREKDLLEKKAVLEENIALNEQKLNSLPDPVLMRKEARIIRLRLQDYFQSEERLKSMGYAEKRRLLSWLFDGEDEDGRPLGIYVRMISKGVYDYAISAKLFAGSKFLKGDDVDYWDEELSQLVDGRIKEYISLRDSRYC